MMRIGMMMNMKINKIQNMKKIGKYCNVIAYMTVAAMTALSCVKVESEDTSESEPMNKVYTAEMVFDGTLTTFDTDTRAASASWQDGDIVYLQFAAGEEFVEGKAFYDSSLSKWNLEFYEELVVGEEMTCQAYYFENAIEVAYNDITLDENSIVYRDDQGAYYYDGQTLTVNAQLSPITGRIRFEGEPGAEYNFYGVSKYTGYSFKTNTFTTETKEFTGSLSESGSSPYYYVFFSEERPRDIYVFDKEGNTRFARKCGSNVLAHGKSGYITLPTLDSHNGWAADEIVKTYTVGDVSFNMILVTNGTFMMGSDAAWADSYQSPVHKVTLTKDYRMGETEVTHELWAEVMGETVTDGAEQIPETNIYYSQCQSFVEYLNALTGGSFRMPTEAEWEFAARGGHISKGYRYSGSDVIDDVAWYSENADGKYKVKQKLPNELGLYDMSGNVWEYTSDYYASYSNQDAVDPTGPANGSYRVSRGGCSNYDAGGCTCTYRKSFDPYAYDFYFGFRLASQLSQN